jgi:hypothetical protein
VDLLLDADGDLAITNNDLVLVDDLAIETAQRIRIKLQLFRGEWFLNPAAGMPYRELIWPKTVPVQTKLNVIRRTLLGDPAIASLSALSLTVDPVTRAATVAFTAVLRDGAILRSGDFAPFVLQPGVA